MYAVRVFDHRMVVSSRETFPRRSKPIEAGWITLGSTSFPCCRSRNFLKEILERGDSLGDDAAGRCDVDSVVEGGDIHKNDGLNLFRQRGEGFSGIWAIASRSASRGTKATPANTIIKTILIGVYWSVRRLGNGPCCIRQLGYIRGARPVFLMSWQSESAKSHAAR